MPRREHELLRKVGQPTAFAKIGHARRNGLSLDVRLTVSYQWAESIMHGMYLESDVVT